MVKANSATLSREDAQKGQRILFYGGLADLEYGEAFSATNRCSRSRLG